MKKIFTAALVAAAALFGLTFGYKNHQRVEINYYFGVHFEADLALLLFSVFALSLLTGYAAGSLRAFRARRRREKLAKTPPPTPAPPSPTLQSPTLQSPTPPAIPTPAHNERKPK